MTSTKDFKLKMEDSTYYVWIGGSCDYGHEERCSGGAYILQQNNQDIGTYSVSDRHTTEFSMILLVMKHAMEVIPPNSNITFISNVQYIQQSLEKTLTENSKNADLISMCQNLKNIHNKVLVKLVPYHKYNELIKAHELAHKAMLEYRYK